MKLPKLSFDRPLYFSLLTLLGIGLIMIASAGVVYGRVRFGDDYYFLKQQLIGLSVGMILLSVFQYIHYKVWQRFVVPIFLVAIVLLVLVFIPGFGTTVYGAARWVVIGPLSSSEVMKFRLFCIWRPGQRSRQNSDFSKDSYHFGACRISYYQQPDTGTLGLMFSLRWLFFRFRGQYIPSWRFLGVASSLFVL
jgi:cell division protein FtsW